MTPIEYKKLVKKSKKNKYKNQKVVVDGIKFDSIKEAKYYKYLKKLKEKGIIKNFERQVSFELIPSYEHMGKKVRPITYVLDFKVEYSDGRIDYVDVKSSRTFQDSVYKLKKKLFHYKYRDIKINEVVDVDKLY